MSARRLFADHGLRCTRQRVAIYDRLKASRSHPTAEELFEQVRGECDGLSLATVYNTLEALCEAGLCRKLTFNCGCARFDAELQPHLHLLNEDTGEIHDVPGDLSERLLAQLSDEVLHDVEKRLGVQIDRVSLHLHARQSGAKAKSNGRCSGRTNGRVDRGAEARVPTGASNKD